ncbi:transmembrane channel-like protein 5 isoform X2 [Callorhinchus milii]|uniref:transmembrane channel-like protein 5 isoform X2 n=1 Tax=Callorhinchus milii TaxID=7868 RepID=UPI000457300A|nr:transmembrane channel-like protein 5 isoform X2 [Callorhinchus milii]|eukprot:gi/632952584/ref/XP_007891931.1/ PREDICTED: transmembrane channel-like protein 5 [Callorhinchus milii]
MFHPENDEGCENQAYYHSETLEMDRRPQDWTLGYHSRSPVQPPYQLPPYDSPELQRRWNQPQIIPMISIRRERDAASPRVTRMNLYEDEDRYVNPGFEPILDDFGSSSSSTYDGYNERGRSFLPGSDTDTETSSRSQDRKRRRRSLGNSIQVGSFGGLSLTRFSFKKHEVTEEEKTAKLQIISELLSMSPNDRMRAIQQLTLCMNEKRQIRASSFPEKNQPTDQVENMINAGTQFLYNTLIALKRFHEIMSETIKSIHPWQRSLKVIGGKFGTSVLSYFTFLKWLLMFNILSFLINFSFITIPQSFEHKPNHFVFTGLDLLTGAGYFRETVFYYGFYSNTTIQRNSSAPEYDMQIAYFLTIACYMVLCFLSLVYSMSKSFNENCIGVGIIAGAAARLLCCWDFNITNERTVALKKRSLSTHLKELISEKLHYKRQLSKKQRVLRIIIHLIAWIVSISTTILCCYLIHTFSSRNFQRLKRFLNKPKKIICLEYLGTNEEYHSWYQWLVHKMEKHYGSAMDDNDSLQRNLSVAGISTILPQRSKIWAVLTKELSGVKFHNEASTLLLPFLVAVINLFVPLLFSFIGFVERFKYPRHEIYALIIRNVMLRMSIIVVLCYYWLEVVANHLECWETFVGEDLYRLVVMDFIFSLLGSFFGEFILSVMGTHCCKRLGVPEFDIARNVLGLIYAQILAWIGMFFAPLLPAIQVIKFFVIFHVKKVSLMMNCQPPRKVWRASHMTTIFIFLLLFPGFVGVLTLLGIVVWKKKSSETCGPFRGVRAPYESISSFIDRLEENYSELTWFVWIYKNLLENSLFFFLLSTMVLAAIYLYLQIIDGRRVMVGLLQEQIAHEGKDKAFLLGKLSALQTSKEESEIEPRKSSPEPPSSSHYGAPGRSAYHRRISHGNSTISDYSEELDMINDFEMDREQPQNHSGVRNGAPNALALVLSARQQAEEEMDMDY